ncbi:MAG: MFS transporter [Desulfovibrionaceae bacterium]|nr:MFS transporter [Desulfovibrionaceae bacterium]
MDTRKVSLASFSHFVCDVNTGALPAILPYFVSTYGFSYSAVSGLMLANSSIGSCIQPFFGLLSDRSPSVWYMPLGILIAGLCMASLSLFSSYLPIFLAVGLSGVGTSLFHPTAMRFTASYAGERQGTATSIFSIGGNIGFLLAPLLAVLLIEHLGFAGIAIFAPIALCMSLLVWFETRNARFAGRPSAEKRGEGALPKNNWPAFFRLTGALIGRSVLMVCLRVFLPLYWIDHFSRTPQEAALLLTIFGLSGIIGNIAGGMLGDRFGYTRVIQGSYGVIVPFLFFFPFVENYLLAYCLVALIGFFLYASFSPVVVVGQRYLAKNAGLAAGVTLGLSISIGGVFAPLLGFLADSFGLLAAFHTLTAIAAVSFLSTVFLVPHPAAEKCP